MFFNINFYLIFKYLIYKNSLIVMKMKGALKPPDCLIWNKNSSFILSIISSMIIVEDSTTVVISLIRSDYGNLTTYINNLQISYTTTPKTYDIFLFVIKVGVINLSNIIIMYYFLLF